MKQENLHLPVLNPSPLNQPSPYLTLTEAAAYARCSKRTIQRHIKAGKLKAHGLGRRPLIEQSELERLLSSTPAKVEEAA